VYEPLQVESLKGSKLTAASGQRSEFLKPRASNVSKGDTTVLHHLSYIKGSTRALTIYIIALGAYELQLDLQTDHPVLFDSLQRVRVLLSPMLAPEDRLLQAMSAQTCSCKCHSAELCSDSF
jgi:hypothetical protein